MTSGLYTIQGPNRTVYVGQSVNVEGRWQEHLRGLARGRHHCKLLQQAFNHFGAHAFINALLIPIDPRQTDILSVERDMIKWYRENGYQLLNTSQNLGAKLLLNGNSAPNLMNIVPVARQFQERRTFGFMSANLKPGTPAAVERMHFKSTMDFAKRYRESRAAALEQIARQRGSK